VRADSCGDSIYFAGWVGATWMDWERFGEVTLDPDAPAVQFTGIGDVGRGQVQVKLAVGNHTAGEQSVTLRVRAADGTGQELAEAERTAVAAPGGGVSFDVPADVAWSAGENVLAVAVTGRGTDGRTKTLYAAQLPVLPLTDELWEKQYAPWLADKPQTGAYKWSYAYWPTYGVIRASLDLDLFGLKPELAAAAAWSLAIAPKGQAKPLAELRRPVEQRRGRMVLETGELAAGEYDVLLRLYAAADGEAVLDEQRASLVRQNYPWEGNDLGKTNRLIPPYTPIRADGLRFSPWGRTYTFAPDGLPAQIEATGGRRGLEPILRAPVRLEALRDGQALSLSDADISVEQAGEARIDLAARGRLGPVGVRVESYLEFDGWYQVRLTLDPGAEPQTLERLSLVAPLWARADTLYVQRSDDLGSNRTDAIPEGEGVVWHSGLLPFAGKRWGSFVPVAFAGTGDKGLWWFAVDSRPWTLSDTVSALEVVRSAEGVDLRFNLLAAPTRLEGARTFEFAFLATPVKPLPEAFRRLAWFSDQEFYGHSTEGYRTYGGSVDGFEMTKEEDFTALADYLPKAFPLVGEGKPMVLYGSTWMCGLGLDAFDTYGGEWLGRSNWAPAPDTHYKGRKNLQGSLTFETPRQLTPLAVANWTPSFLDCFVWHHHQLLTKCPVNGTWWDNSSIGVFTDYDPVAKEFVPQWNVFMRRALTKRLATLGWEIGREPWWLMNLHVDFSWCQLAWHVENDFWPRSTEGTILDELSVDQFRALCRTKQGVVPVLDSKMVFRGVSRRQHWHQARASYGLCLLHDIGGRAMHNPGAPVHRALLDAVSRHVDFFGDAEFFPYWDNADLIANSVPGTRISIYRDARRALLVIMNVTGEDIPFPRLKLGPELMPGKRDYQLKVYDAESAEGWRCANGVWFTYNENHLRFERHGLMLLVVE
jgi:hypothetical protein